jgi:hypothetical protein
MTTAMKTKALMAGAKRKADASKESPSKGLKKPKIDSAKSLRPHVEPKRPEKTAAVARRLISGALGVPVTKKTENLAVIGSNGKKDTKVPRAQVVKAKGPIVKKATVQTQTDSSDDDFDEFDEDGGVALDDAEDSDTEESLPTVQQGVHPDRVKANGNGAGLNGTILYSRLTVLF